MTITEVDRDGDYILVTTDGRKVARSVLDKDVIVSVPPTGYKKIKVMYIDPITEKVVVVYDPDS